LVVITVRIRAPTFYFTKMSLSSSLLHAASSWRYWNRVFKNQVLNREIFKNNSTLSVKLPPVLLLLVKRNLILHWQLKTPSPVCFLDVNSADERLRVVDYLFICLTSERESQTFTLCFPLWWSDSHWLVFAVFFPSIQAVLRDVQHIQTWCINSISKL